MGRIPTIKDVAKRAGVAVSTASLALNGKPGVSAETRAKVLKAALELNYHPHVAAKNLADGRARTIGLIAPITLEHLFSSAGFFMKLIKGMHQAAQREGYVISLYIAESEDEASVNIRSLIRSHAVDGLVITNPTFSSIYINELRGHPIPYVFIGRPVEKVPFVDNDNVEVGRLATEHLINHGHTAIVCLCGPGKFTFCQDRLSGYRKALEKAGIPFRNELVWCSEITEEAAYSVVKEQAPTLEFTAIFALTDVQAVGAIRALREIGYKIPEDVAVVGVNESPLARHFVPPLTTVDLHEEELGLQAVTYLLGMIKNRDVTKQPIYISSEIIRRSSCGCKEGR